MSRKWRLATTPLKLSETAKDTHCSFVGHKKTDGLGAPHSILRRSRARQIYVTQTLGIISVHIRLHQIARDDAATEERAPNKGRCAAAEDYFAATSPKTCGQPCVCLPLQSDAAATATAEAIHYKEKRLLTATHSAPPGVGGKSGMRRMPAFFLFSVLSTLVTDIPHALSGKLQLASSSKVFSRAITGLDGTRITVPQRRHSH